MKRSLNQGRKAHLFAIMSALFMFLACRQVPQPENIKVNVIASEFIYDQAPFPQCHASTITETGTGLLVAWFGGTHEKHPDVCIYTASKNNGNWEAPRIAADGIISDTLRYPCWNPVLFKTDKGEIVLYYKVGPNPREWWGLTKVSHDNGNTWPEAKPIPDGCLGPIKNKPVRLADGLLLYPSSTETGGIWKIHTETSGQDLINWEKRDIDNNGFSAIQPTVLFHKDGRLQMLCRSKEKKIVETWSSDQGKTWTPVKATSLVNNNSGIDGVTLENGLHLLTCNPVENGRNKLSLLASADGIKWTEILMLEDQPEGEFSYPAIIRADDGTVHITYTWNRRKIKHVQLRIS